MPPAKDRGKSSKPAPARAQSPKARALGAGAWVLAGLWLAITLLLAWGVHSNGLRISGEVQGLLPEVHRAHTGDPWLLVEAGADARTTPTEGSAPEQAGRSNLLAAALAIAQALPEERVALAPPSNAVTAWLDAHGLYLLPVERHAELSERLKDENVSAAIQGLMARLSSPFFGVAGEDARRDPLGLAPIVAHGSGELGHIQVDDASAATVTGTGDLLSADGRRLLIQLRSRRSPDELAGAASKAVADLPVNVSLVGPDAQSQQVATRTEAAWPRLFGTLAAALALVLAFALRRIRPVLGLFVGLLGGLLIIVRLAPAIDPLALPLYVLLPGFCCGAALHLPRFSGKGWASAALITTALLPLWLSPYPEWKAWSLGWLIAAFVLTLTVRAVVPALMELMRAPVDWGTRGFVLTPMPWLALLLLVGLTTAGAWSSSSLRYVGADSVRIASPEYDERQSAVVDSFFDPRQLVETRTSGPTPAAALERASSEVETLAGLVGPDAVRLDSPASFVTPTAKLERRMKSLSSFELPKRMQKLHDTLEAQGLVADAFTEFLHGAADIESLPTAQAALDDSLGTWMDRYLVEDPEADAQERWALRSVLQLRPKTTVPSPTGEHAESIVFRGPTIAARIDAGQFRERLGIYIACGLWLGAFLVWLGTRSLPIALAAGMVGLATQSSVLVLHALMRQPIGPQALPVLLLVGVAGMVAAGRACRAVDLRMPLVAGSMLTAGICQIAAGLTLLVSGEPLWQQMGLVVAVGSAVAVGLGLFAAPGLCNLLRRAHARRQDGADSHDKDRQDERTGSDDDGGDDA